MIEFRTLEDVKVIDPETTDLDLEIISKILTYTYLIEMHKLTESKVVLLDKNEEYDTSGLFISDILHVNGMIIKIYTVSDDGNSVIIFGGE